MIFRDDNDRHVYQEVVEQDEYRRWGDITIEKDDKVIDIGAHIGSFTVLALECGAHVWAYEPDVDNFEMLYKNVSGYQGRAHCFQEAVSKETGQMLMVKGGRTDLHRLLNTYPDDQKNMLGPSSEAISVTTLDDIIKKVGSIDLLKLDCEAAEYDILYHSRRLDMIKQITMEWHLGAIKAAELMIYLNEQGFKSVWFAGNGEWGKLQLKRKDILLK